MTRTPIPRASKDVGLAGHVQAEGKNGFQFTTESAVYRAERALLTTSDRITLINGPLRVTGVGLELHADSRQARILHQVEAVIVPERQ